MSLGAARSSFWLHTYFGQIHPWGQEGKGEKAGDAKVGLVSPHSCSETSPTTLEPFSVRQFVNRSYFSSADAGTGADVR